MKEKVCLLLNDWANQYFQEQLHGNVDGVAIGMAYFRQRGFRDEIIKKFQLGYALSTRCYNQSGITTWF